jgi:hypothetical protein
MSRLAHVRVELGEANAFVSQYHRHHQPVVGHLFSLGATLEDKIVGVCIVGRPVSRMRDDGMTAEVTRLCTDGTRNACSFLYGAAARAAFALGFTKIGTYILASESGTSLTAAGWRLIGERGGGSWSVPSRPRVDKHPTQKKLLFESVPRHSYRAKSANDFKAHGFPGEKAK